MSVVEPIEKRPLPARKHAAELLSIVGVVCGVLCLISGVCVILIWAFVPNFSKLHPVGLQIGAIVCSLGVGFILLCVVSLVRWQVKLGRITRRVRALSPTRLACRRKMGNVYQFQLPAYHTHTTEKDEKLFATLKKANSTAFISFGGRPPETVQVVGIVHDGTISTTELNHPSVATISPAIKSMKSAIFSFNGDSKLASSRYTRQPFIRDKFLRRSLPRVLVHPPSGRISVGRDNSNSERLAKAKSEGLKLDRLSEPQSNSCSIPADDRGFRTGADTASTDDPKQTLLARDSPTTPLGETSLFTLHNSGKVVLDSGAALADSSVASKHESRSNLEGTASGKRLLLMNQSGQVISCTTLFGDEDTEDDSNGVSCRRLPSCAGWNFFPVFVEQDQFTESVASEEDGELVEARLNRTVDLAGPAPQNATTPQVGSGSERHRSESRKRNAGANRLRKPRGVIERLKQFVRGRFRNEVNAPPTKVAAAGQPDTGLVAETSQASPHSATLTDDARDCPKLEKRKPCNANPDLSSVGSYHDGGATRTHSEQSDSGPDGMQSSTSNLKVSRKQTIVSNASVFSLPAMPPEMWSVERPVWIMGVPVRKDQHWLALDACDVIVLKKRTRSGSIDPMNHHSVTGSTSSIYAFHVKPPARLKPSTRNSRAVQHVRARSLGRILMSEKQSCSQPH
ncbi:hypothetical protein P879_07525 [Paragonimus westermani]|uniref:Uncharacterized protein n=1 Tax=Paragonimus westermani TaxID=34504 RepID=A0A8T0DMW0_9TREM|nr:hypothetical protein P879_07525 [Paragonimus westermani]